MKKKECVRKYRDLMEMQAEGIVPVFRRDENGFWQIDAGFHFAGKKDKN